MQVGMMEQILSPGVENGEEADLSAEVFRIGSDGLESFGRGAEENAINDFLVLNRNGCNLFGHRKDHVKIRTVENFRLPVRNPFCPGQRLTFGTVAVGARVIPDAWMAAPIAFFGVSAEGRSLASFDGGHDTPLVVRQ